MGTSKSQFDILKTKIKKHQAFIDKERSKLDANFNPHRWERLSLLSGMLVELCIKLFDACWE